MNLELKEDGFKKREKIIGNTYGSGITVTLKISKMLVKPMENTNLKCSFTLEVPGSMNKLCEVTHVPGGSAVATGIDRNCRGLITL